MCISDALRSTITTPLAIIGNVTAFLFLVAVLATPHWYDIQAELPPSVRIDERVSSSHNYTISWNMGAVYYCYYAQGYTNITGKTSTFKFGNYSYDLPTLSNCVFAFHNVQGMEQCKNSTYSDADIAACGATEVMFFLFYFAFILNLVTGALTFFMCCAKCVTCGCCGNSFSFLAAIPATLGVLCLLLSVFMAFCNVNAYSTYLNAYGFLSESLFDSVTVQLGLSFYLALVATVATIVTSIVLSCDARHSALDCCAKTGEEYALW